MKTRTKKELEALVADLVKERDQFRTTANSLERSWRGEIMDAMEQRRTIISLEDRIWEYRFALVMASVLLLIEPFVGVLKFFFK